MHSRFFVNEDGSRIKYIEHKDKKFKITIPSSIWNTIPHRKISDHIQYWKKRLNMGKMTVMKYGTIEEISSEICTTGEYRCDVCKRTYKTRSGLYKHTTTNECTACIILPSDEEPINERTETTVHNITTHNDNRQTNNIQINLPIRNFSEENPKWLTPDVIMAAIGNLPDAIPRLIREKHFNDKFPENQNLRIDTKRNIRKRLRVYDGGRWKIRDRPDVEYGVISQVYDVMHDLIELVTDDEEPEYDDDTAPTDRRIAQISRKIRASQTRSMRVRRIIADWRAFTESLESDYEKAAEPLGDKFDTLLLDNELRIQQLEEKRERLES
jgi:hypothetical protein